MGYILQNINYFINVSIFFGFVVSFKKISHDLIIRLIIVSIIMSFINTTFLYANLLIKNIFILLGLGFTCRFIVKLTYKEFVIKYMIFLAMNFLCELLTVPLFSSYLKDGIFHVSALIQIIITVILNCLLFAVLKGHLYFLKNIMYLKNNYFISFCLLLMLMTISSLLAVLFTINIFQYYIYLGNFVNPPFLIFLYIIWIILLAMIIYHFIRQYHDEKNRIAMQEIPAHYQKLLNQISLKDQEDYSRLKHDIINYLQTYNALQNDKKGE